MGESDDVFEMDILAEAEVSKLQKQYRQIENEHAAFLDEKEKQQRKYDKITRILDKERAHLKFTIEADECGPHNRRENEVKKHNLSTAKFKGTISRLQFFCGPALILFPVAVCLFNFLEVQSLEPIWVLI